MKSEQHKKSMAALRKVKGPINITELAKKLDVTRNSLVHAMQKLSKEEGLEFDTSGSLEEARKKQAIRVATIKELLPEGYTVYQIAEILEISRDYVYRIIRKHDLESYKTTTKATKYLNSQKMFNQLLFDSIGLAGNAELLDKYKNELTADKDLLMEAIRSNRRTLRLLNHINRVEYGNTSKEG